MYKSIIFTWYEKKKYFFLILVKFIAVFLFLCIKHKTIPNKKIISGTIQR